MFETPKTYTEGMEEMVKWANGMEEKLAHRFMLDLYKIYIEWRYVFETAPKEEYNGDNTGE